MKKISTYILLTILITILSLTLSTSLTFAADDKKFTPPYIPKAENLPGPEKSELEKEGGRKILTERTLPKFTVRIIGFVGGASLIFLVIGGVRFAMAYGKEESVENAKKQVIYAVIGLLIALLAFTIVSIISNIELKSNTGKGAQPKAQPVVEPVASLENLTV